jgi:hypothetical protein
MPKVPFSPPSPSIEVLLYHVTGDGHAFRDFLEANYPDVVGHTVGRAELSKRQDWSCEASFAVYPLFEPILRYIPVLPHS